MNENTHIDYCLWFTNYNLPYCSSNTALFAFTEICQPKPGQIVVITGAAGAVGSHVAQIAKHKGNPIFFGTIKNKLWLNINIFS